MFVRGMYKVPKFQQVYLAPDRTKDERNKRKDLVKRFKEKKKLESGLQPRIKDGTILSGTRTKSGS